VLERFANRGIRDQIARVCIDGSAKFPAFVIPTIARQLETGGPIEHATAGLAAWARYLAVVDPAAQAFDASAAVARRHAAAALADPAAFLEFEAVFPPSLRSSRRFREEFSLSYRRIAESGPIAALEFTLGPRRIRGTR
jgi:mannitol 2-dehydrogenase